LLLLLAARASKVRAGATIAAATYTLIYIGMILVLPLFPAQPKLAPVYHPVDHMVPPAFPLLLIVPAVAIDVIHWLLVRSSKTATRQPPPTDAPVLFVVRGSFSRHHACRAMALLRLFVERCRRQPFLRAQRSLALLRAAGRLDEQLL
jgi:hypothetical protein